MKKKINQWACYNRIWWWSPMPCEKHGPRDGRGFCRNWGPRAIFFTRHGRPWSNPTWITFTIIEIQIWLPDFLLVINPIRIFCAWPIWTEVTRFLGNNTMISSLSIDRPLNIQITTWTKIGNTSKHMPNTLLCASGIGETRHCWSVIYWNTPAGMGCSVLLKSRVYNKAQTSQITEQKWHQVAIVKAILLIINTCHKQYVHAIWNWTS